MHPPIPSFPHCSILTSFHLFLSKSILHFILQSISLPLSPLFVSSFISFSSTSVHFPSSYLFLSPFHHPSFLHLLISSSLHLHPSTDSFPYLFIFPLFIHNLSISLSFITSSFHLLLSTSVHLYPLNSSSFHLRSSSLYGFISSSPPLYSSASSLFLHLSFHLFISSFLHPFTFILSTLHLPIIHSSSHHLLPFNPSPSRHLLPSSVVYLLNSHVSTSAPLRLATSHLFITFLLPLLSGFLRRPIFSFCDSNIFTARCPP